MLVRKVDVIKRRGREKGRVKGGGNKKDECRDSGDCSDPKGKKYNGGELRMRISRWYGGIQRSIDYLGCFQLQITEIGRKQGIP
jgi:hypothetical protein